MARPDPVWGERLPWLTRLIDRLPVPPALGALGVAAAVYATFFAFTTAFGAGPGILTGLRLGEAWLPELILAIAIGAAPAITVYTLRGSLRDLESLRPLLGGGDADLGALRRRISTFPRGPLRAAGCVVAAAAAVLLITDPATWVAGRAPALGDPSLTWIVARNMVHAWLVARAVLLEIYLARAFSTLGAELSPPGLLDPDPLRPFGRRGLRSVLLWMLMAALHSLLYLGGWANYFLAPSLVAIVGLAFAALLLPALGVRDRLRAEKRAELSRVHAAIHRLRDRSLAAVDPSGGGLADLLAWEERVRGVREWPFDVSSALRFALYLGVGLGSWLGAALVERALERALS